jgi:hypothetical protein
MTSIRVAVAFILGFTCLTAIGMSQGYVHNGFLTGRQYLDLPTVGQNGYAAGLIDGMFLAPFFGAPNDRVAVIENCVNGMTDQQVAAILAGHLRSKPEIWHLGAHTALYQALIERCPK